MSFDLLLFDKTKAPMFFDDFLEWTAIQTEWGEDRDYNAVEGTSSQLVAWFMEMKERFPPLNGPYSLDDEEAFADIETEKRLTDYSIGGSVIYASFGWSVAEKAEETAMALARKHDVGLFNPQNYDIVCDEMVVAKMRTERHDDHNVAWEVVERSLLSLDSPERGTSNRNGAAITLWFAQNGTDEEWLQCSPLYSKPEGFFQRLFGLKKGAAPVISSYTVEAGTGEKIYARQVGGKDELKQLFHEYYVGKKLPDISGWKDTGIL